MNRVFKFLKGCNSGRDFIGRDLSGLYVCNGGGNTGYVGWKNIDRRTADYGY